MSRQLSELARHRWALLSVAAFTAVALLLTLMVVGTLSQAQDGDKIRVTAVFTDATGLRAGDDVRVAGVRVGRVQEARLGTGDRTGQAVVTLEVRSEQRLHDDVVASIDYLNLMGQRFVDLSRPEPSEDAGALADGDTIPLGRTRPALDLTALFNAFEPIFELLQPGDINLLMENIVQVLQGQGPTMQHLLAQTADLTSGIVERDAALAEVVDNVTAVLETTEAHRGEIDSLLVGLGRLTKGLADDRRQLASSLDSLARLSDTTADLIEDAGPGLTQDIRLGRALLRHWTARVALFGETLTAMPRQLAVYLRTLGYGSFLNTYVCTLSFGMIGRPERFELGPGTRHSERCR